jgi:hypothetical protein
MGAILLALVIGGTIVVAGAVQAWARVMAQRSAGSGAEVEMLRREVDMLRADLEVAGALGERVAEMEERLDFAERLLAQRDAPRLGQGEQ